MLLHVHPENPEIRKIGQIADRLRNGEIIIYPTDTIYGLGCDIFNQKAIERICRIRKLDPSKAYLTIICANLSQLAEYTQQIDNHLFRVLKRNLPGKFTFILKAHNKIPKIFKSKRKTVGIRIPDNRIAQAIVSELGHPILSISLKSDLDINEYLTDPIEIYEHYRHLVDIVIDGGPGANIPSTIINCIDNELKIVRQGGGELN